MSDVYERLFEANVRIEQAWPFPVGPASSELMEAFETAGDENVPAEIKALLASWDEAEIDELFDSGRDAFDELFAAAFRGGVRGWIGIAAVPVFERTRSGGASFSWGYYNTNLIFSATADGLLTAAAEWGEQLYEAAIAKALTSEGADHG